MKKLDPLPKSNDKEFWEESSEKYVSSPVVIPICKTHGKHWKSHVGYISNGDGTASCTKCNWGFIVPGYLRIYEGKVVDLRER